ncbi:hypothetical protein NDU88_001893 [Pleurodeles waltl]|uniref:Uncharacterized protein n=1 Tax=Pleurodeles waltl TaxID=8319 RepID=A0AAV7SBP2_PLEWA|nr:hypothetical protein NDU88_001893 [Pleurodeles waltl]
MPRYLLTNMRKNVGCPDTKRLAWVGSPADGRGGSVARVGTYSGHGLEDRIRAVAALHGILRVSEDEMSTAFETQALIPSPSRFSLAADAALIHFDVRVV